MKLYILDTGHLMGSSNSLVAPITEQEAKNPKIVPYPVMCFLIDHPTAGYILYDLGCNNEAMNGYWSENLRTSFAWVYTKEQLLENQLALCGIKPIDIKTVVLSHMHLDHAGNLEMFKHADVYVPKADFINGLVTVHSSSNVDDHSYYIREDLTPYVKKYHLIEEDFTLAEGVEVINIPGHAPNVLGLVLHLKKDGTIILPQDALYTSVNYGPPARKPGIMYDEKEFMESVEKIRLLANKYNAKIIFSHDCESFKGFRLAPKFYE